MANTWLMLLVVLLMSAKAIGDPFEVLMVVHQWGAGFCQLNTCDSTVTIPVNYTIHGMWPTNHTVMLKGCSKFPYVKETDPVLVGELIKTWPDFKRNYTDTVRDQWLWGHEWDIHGTCMFPQTSQRDYYRITMGFKNGMDFYKELGKRGIVPRTNSYTFTEIDNAVTQALSGKKADLSCGLSGPKGATRRCDLVEIRACYDPTTRALVDCPLKQTDPVKRNTTPRSQSCSGLTPSGPWPSIHYKN